MPAKKVATPAAPAKPAAPVKPAAPAAAAVPAPAAAPARPARPAAKAAVPPPVEVEAETNHEVEEVFTFGGYLDAAQAAVLAAGEYVQITALSDNVEGTQFYEVTALQNTPEQGETERKDVVAHSELVALTPEQEVELQQLFGEPAAEEVAAEGAPAAEGDAATGKAERKPRAARKGGRIKPIIAFTGVAHVLEAGEDLIEFVRGKIATAEQSWFEAAEGITIIKKQKTYAALNDPETGAQLYPEGKEGFSKFVSEHLGVGYRTVQHWIKIVDQFKRLGTKDPEILKLGWAKLKEIARVLERTEGTPAELTEHIKTLVEYAGQDGVSDRDVAKWVSEEWITAEEPGAATTDGTTTAPAGDGASRKKVAFFVTGEDQAANVEAALKAAGEAIGVADDANKQFLYIIDQFIASVSVNASAPAATAPAKAPSRPAAKKAAAIKK